MPDIKAISIALPFSTEYYGTPILINIPALG